MPRPSHLSPDNILRFLQVRTAPASTAEIAQGLHLRKSDNRSLFKMLSKLKKRRAIEELPGGRYRLPSRKSERSAPIQKPPQNVPRHIQTLASHDEITGRLVLHHDGYGFVVPDSPMPQLDGDVFIPRDAIQDAMHGDHVLAKIQRLGGVTGAQRAEGRIIRVLDRAHPTVVGLFRYGSQRNVVLPYDVRIQHEIEIPRGNELTPGLWKKLGFSGADETSIRSRRIPRLGELDGAVVNVELLRYPHGGASPTGRVIEILGRPGDLGVDTEIICRMSSPPRFLTKPSAARSPSANPSAPATKTSVTCPSSPSMAKPRAISTTPSMSSIAPTAAGTCKFTSPTSGTMFEPPRLSTRKRVSAAHPFTFPTALSPCFRRLFRTACARSSPVKIAWS